MSQRYFKNERYEVLVGWDRPLQYFFMVIQDETVPEDNDDSMVYSNQNDPEGPGLSFDRIHAVLHQFQITPPLTLWRDLQKDKQDDVGNLVVRYRFEPTFAGVESCICNPNPAGEDLCFCSDLEKALRAYSAGMAMPAMTEGQRTYCLDEISRVEGYERKDYEASTEADLARGVLNAWTDYCRDKGLLS